MLKKTNPELPSESSAVPSHSLLFSGDEDDALNLSALRIGGTEMHYFVLCPRKLWWFSHGLEQEHAGGASASSGQENVALGTLLHGESYGDKKRRDILIDDLLRLDFTDGGQIHEIKKTHGGSKAYQATRAQLLYYLFYLKHQKGIETTGVIDWPQQKRRETVVLDDEAEADVVKKVQELQMVRQLATPPVVDAPMTICRKCAYQELCWG